MWRFLGFLWALPLLLLSGSALAADFPISGRVVDGHGRPVAGATVLLVQGQTEHQAVTDTQGLFQFNVNSAGTMTSRSQRRCFNCFRNHSNSAPGQAALISNSYR